MESEETIPHDLPVINKKMLAFIAVSVILLFAVIFIIGWWPRHNRVAEHNDLAMKAAEEKPVVQVIQPTSTDAAVDLSLPADVRAFASTALYARITGFLDHWNVDINDRVKEGDVLAIISAPDTDADLKQAVANLDQANANINQQQTNLNLANVTLKRYEGLIDAGGVTQQTLDQYRSAQIQAVAMLGAAEANKKSAQAAVDKITALQGFEIIKAPFDGVITARNYDRGALINSANTAAGQELFDIARDDQLRVFVSVPQSYSTFIKFDLPGALVVSNYPSKEFSGKVARSAGVIDPATRTLRTELDVANLDHQLFAGMYGQAKFKLKRERPVITIPSSAMLFEAKGTQVAVVDDKNHLHFQMIKVGRDLGTEIEVADGLTGSERIVSNPGGRLAEGIEVSVTGSKDDAQGPAVKSASADTQTPEVRVAVQVPQVVAPK